MKRLLFLSLFVLACSGKPHRPGINPERGVLFPNGVYQHEVKLWIRSRENQDGHHTFSGVIKKAANRMDIVGLGLLSTTMFKISGERGKTPTVKIFTDHLKGKEEKLKELYSLLKEVMDLKMTHKASVRLSQGSLVH